MNRFLAIVFSLLSNPSEASLPYSRPYLRLTSSRIAVSTEASHLNEVQLSFSYIYIFL